MTCSTCNGARRIRSGQHDVDCPECASASPATSVEDVYGVWYSSTLGSGWTNDPTKWTRARGNVRFSGTRAEAGRFSAIANGRPFHNSERRAGLTYEPRPLDEAGLIAPKPLAPRLAADEVEFEAVRAENDRVRARIVDMADEMPHYQPVLPTDELLTIIDRYTRETRAENECLRADLQQRLNTESARSAAYTRALRERGEAVARISALETEVAEEKRAHSETVDGLVAVQRDKVNALKRGVELLERAGKAERERAESRANFTAALADFDKRLTAIVAQRDATITDLRAKLEKAERTLKPGDMCAGTYDCPCSRCDKQRAAAKRIGEPVSPHPEAREGRRCYRCKMPCDGSRTSTVGPICDIWPDCRPIPDAKEGK